MGMERVEVGCGESGAGVREGNGKGREIKKTPRRRISVTSSLHEIFHSSAGNNY
jgi:hypothetical protein